jgi:putative toxin-antitoxin system antitoxin component (TIGR02293 family)
VTAADTVAFLGGANVFGRAVATELELAREVARGFPSGSLDVVLRALQSEAIPQSSIYAVVGTARTLQRKRQRNTRLSHDESDRLARLARLAVRAGEALGSSEKGQRWLGKPNRALDGMRPLDLLTSDTGAVLVEDVLGRIEHGVAS